MSTANYTDVLALLQGSLASQYSTVVPIAILCYDYCLTFATEMESFWSRKISWASVLFFLNRYVSLLGTIPTVLEFFESPSNNCYALIVQVIVAALLIVRTYALYDKDRRILALLLMACVVGGAIAIVPVGVPRMCNILILGPAVIPSCPTNRTWSFTLILDTLVFSLTVAKVIQIGGLRGFRRSDLLRMLLRDGVIYYAIMVVINIANIVSYMVAILRDNSFHALAHCKRPVHNFSKRSDNVQQALECFDVTTRAQPSQPRWSIIIRPWTGCHQNN
ncbi:hypothetical protein OBBRIDRAFT_872046 [Obba rivulosa]|uniref:DUF6533 domain-containing protein n=1 Tax=Obba rivulosa TaxID=1052685 RepID=A0A8E2B0L4_9APHY|nr:hypothetical protein OBBRIDRAFT_872046 [Obba rivulosa]